jgi:hypothetical protein
MSTLKRTGTVRCTDCPAELPVQVCESGAGYYIGRWCDTCGPFERLSQRYWPSQQEAQAALDSGLWEDRAYAFEYKDVLASLDPAISRPAVCGRDTTEGKCLSVLRFDGGRYWCPSCDAIHFETRLPDSGQ